MELDMYSASDVRRISKRFDGLDDKAAWRKLVREWKKHEAGEIGIPTTPHECAIRFIHDWTRAEVGEGAFAAGPEPIYLALREAFYQAMTLATEAHGGPGSRWVK
jgi:hypothetical protein